MLLQLWLSFCSCLMTVASGCQWLLMVVGGFGGFDGFGNLP